MTAPNGDQPGDEFDAAVDRLTTAGMMSDSFERITGQPLPPAPVSPAGPAPITLYGFRCPTCAPEQIPTTEDRVLRDDQAADHARRFGHQVTMFEATDATGTTITGHVDPIAAPVDRQPAPTEPPPAAGRARPPRPAPPLVAFIARADGADPDLMCRIPPRAGAAWLLTAAHACALGRGSLGIQVAHRVLFCGRVTRDPDCGSWSVRIDGLLGATDARFGTPVGSVWAVDGHAELADVEDAVERLIAWEHMLPRNEFTVVLMSDAPVADPPDPHAEQVLREERLAARQQYRSDGRIPPLDDTPG